MTYVPKVGEPYQIDKDGQPEPYVYNFWREWGPWLSMLLGASIITIGLAVWLGWIIPVLVGLYFLLGIIWIVWSAICSPKTVDEARRGGFYWHPERLLNLYTDAIFTLVIVLPTWPWWALGIAYV